MLQAVQLPAGVADLDARLPHVDGDALALEAEQRVRPSDTAVVSARHADLTQWLYVPQSVSGFLKPCFQGALCDPFNPVKPGLLQST